MNVVFRRAIAAFATVVLVVVSALAGYYAGTGLNHGATVTTTSIATTFVTTTSVMPVSCSSPVSASNATGMIQVFKIDPASTGVICINFQFSTTGNFLPNLLFSASGGPICMTKNETNNPYALSCDVELFPSISSFNHHAGQSVTVA